jgi:hypothetical protein
MSQGAAESSALGAGAPPPLRRCARQTPPPPQAPLRCTRQLLTKHLPQPGAAPCAPPAAPLPPGTHRGTMKSSP